MMIDSRIDADKTSHTLMNARNGFHLTVLMQVWYRYHVSLNRTTLGSHTDCES